MDEMQEPSVNSEQDAHKAYAEALAAAFSAADQQEFSDDEDVVGDEVVIVEEEGDAKERECLEAEKHHGSKCNDSEPSAAGDERACEEPPWRQRRESSCTLKLTENGRLAARVKGSRQDVVGSDIASVSDISSYSDSESNSENSLPASPMTPPSGTEGHNRTKSRRARADGKEKQRLAEFEQRLRSRAARFNLPDTSSDNIGHNGRSKTEMLIQEGLEPSPTRRGARSSSTSTSPLLGRPQQLMDALLGDWQVRVGENGQGKQQWASVERSGRTVDRIGRLRCDIWECETHSGAWRHKAPSFPIRILPCGQKVLWGTKGKVNLDLATFSPTHATWFSEKPGKGWSWWRSSASIPSLYTHRNAWQDSQGEMRLRLVEARERQRQEEELLDQQNKAVHTDTASPIATPTSKVAIDRSMLKRKLAIAKEDAKRFKKAEHAEGLTPQGNCAPCVEDDSLAIDLELASSESIPSQQPDQLDPCAHEQTKKLDNMDDKSGVGKKLKRKRRNGKAKPCKHRKCMFKRRRWILKPCAALCQAVASQAAENAEVVVQPRNDEEERARARAFASLRVVLADIGQVASVSAEVSAAAGDDGLPKHNTIATVVTEAHCVDL